MEVEQPHAGAAVEEWRAYSELWRGRAEAAERLLREIGDGKHSLPGVLIQIERLFEHLKAEGSSQRQ